MSHHDSLTTPQDDVHLANDFPSPERTEHVSQNMNMSNELANQAAAFVAASHHPARAPSPSLPYSPYHVAPDSHLSNSQQLSILRDAYARNPKPSMKDLEELAEATGRPWSKIREYFRQRRNKLRGLVDLELMEEPGRAAGWLQVTYRAGPSTSSVSQLGLYSAYKDRFDHYHTDTPLLGGQELIQLACATLQGCFMARDAGDYILRGLKERKAEGSAAEFWEKGLESLFEPLRAGTWLLSNYQQPSDPGSLADLTQTDLYTSYATRFSSFLADSTQSDEEAAELRDFEANMTKPATDIDVSFASEGPATTQDRPRLLNPVELFSLARMAYPKCEPAVDDAGRFVIKGLERRVAVEKGRAGKMGHLFPFALTSQSKTADPVNPFGSLLKRKLALLNPGPEGLDPKKVRSGQLDGVDTVSELSEADRELLDGLKRFKGSQLGQEVRDICVNQ